MVWCSHLLKNFPQFAVNHKVKGFGVVNKAVDIFVWLVFCDYSFYSICLLIDKDKRLVEDSWWVELALRESGSCSELLGHAQ